MLPGQSALIPAASLFSKYPSASRKLASEWLIQSLRYGRYSGASHTAIEEDLKDIDRSSTPEEAIGGMRGRIRAIEDFTSDFFMRDYSDGKFGRLMLYLLAFRNKAEDWDATPRRIAFDGEKLMPGYEPQFHHVFPRKFLKDGVDDSLIEALGNIAIIGGSTNVKISAKNPLDYFDKYGIGPDKCKQQFIDRPITSMTPDNYPKWLRGRAEKLATASNELIAELRPR